MNKLNLLPKLASMGVVATSLSLSGIMLTTNNATAAVCGFALPTDSYPLSGTPPFVDPCIEGGKSITDIVVTANPFGGGQATELEFEFLQPLANEHVFDAVYEDSDNPGTPGDPVFESGPLDYMVTYAVNILDNPNAFFHEVEIDSITVGDGSTITKEIFSDAGMTNLIGEIESIDGSAESIKLTDKFQTLYIKDTIMVAEGAALEAYDNGFIQKENVPEPASILGILAVGGLGLGLKRKKQ